MDAVCTQQPKIVEENKKNLILNEKKQRFLEMYNLQQINFDLYTKVCVSMGVAKKLDLFQNAFSLAIPREKCFEIIYQSKHNKFFSKMVPQNPELIEKMEINFKSPSPFFYNNEDLLIYTKYFPNLKFLTLLMNCNNKSSRDFIDNRVEFLEHFKFIENVEILINDIRIIKRKDNVKILQLVSTLKQLKINFQKEIKNQVLQFIDHIIDLTNKDNNKLILQLTQKDYSQFDFIQTPHSIKLFGNNTSLQQSIQILDKLSNINQVHIVFSKEDEDEQDFCDNLKNFISKIQNLKKAIIIDTKVNNVVQRYYDVMSICQQKFNNFKITWGHKQKIIAKYNPNLKYLKVILSKQCMYNQYNLTEEEYIQILKSHPNAEKLLIQSNEQQQLAIQAISLFNNLKILKFELWFYQNPLDFKLIYHMNLQKIEFNLTRNLSNIQHNFESLLNHPTCPLISSNIFEFNTQLKYVKIQILTLKHSEFYANLILSKYQDTQKIDFSAKNQLLWYSFFAKILASPSLLVINQSNNYRQLQDKTSKQLYDIFKVIQIQKFQIKVIEKHLIGFIPVYLPSLIYDLFC